LYVRKEEWIGHLLLIKIVHIFMNNPVLAKQGIHIADTPGTDSMNEAAREITFGYLKEADAVVYLAEARGLSTNFNLIREELSKYHNSIREKMFIVANKADWYEVKSMAKEGGDKAPIEVGSTSTRRSSSSPAAASPSSSRSVRATPSCPTRRSSTRRCARP
jgi:GTPase involved in cell partitioning and DNA repair